MVCGDISAGAGGPRDSDIGIATLSILREELSFGIGAQGSLWLSADPNPMDILRLPAAVQHRLRLRIAVAETQAGQILLRNRDLLIELSTALVKTQLLEGADLQGFIERVVVEGESEAQTMPSVSVCLQATILPDDATERTSFGGD